jgi:hypothetical protein
VPRMHLEDLHGDGTGVLRRAEDDGDHSGAGVDERGMNSRLTRTVTRTNNYTMV